MKDLQFIKKAIYDGAGLKAMTMLLPHQCHHCKNKIWINPDEFLSQFLLLNTLSFQDWARQ